MAVAIDLSGRRALVTGGSRGIGRAVCARLAAAGADVAVGFVSDHDGASETCGLVDGEGRRAAALRGDLSNPADAENVVRTAADELGGLDIVVANAGVWERAPLAELDAETLRRTLALNVEGVIHTCRAAAEVMSSGDIVLIGSTAGLRGEPEYSAYAASKGAVHLFAKSVAVELAPRGIRVNTVAPGWVDTDMTREALAARREEILREIPVGRVATPDDVAGAVLFLCSHLARHVVGAVIDVNGGSVLD